MLLNFLFDLVILLSVNYILKRNIKLKRLIEGSLLGELSIIFLFINNQLLIILKILLSILMIIYTFNYKDLKYFIKNITYFYLISMLLGGAIYFLKNEFKIPYIYIIIISIFILIKYLKILTNYKIYTSYYYNIDLYFNNKDHLILNAYLDSGNCLKDPYTNKDIILVNKDKVHNKNKSLYVPFSSLNNTDLLECIKGFKLIINGKTNTNFLIGISEDKIMMDGIDCIINNNILEGLKW